MRWLNPVYRHHNFHSFRTTTAVHQPITISVGLAAIEKGDDDIKYRG
jgi:hypothetical protein